MKWEETRHRKRESRPVLQTKHCKKGLVRAQTQASDPKVRVWAKPVRPVLPVIGPRCKIRKQKLRERGPREIIIKQSNMNDRKIQSKNKIQKNNVNSST